MNFNLLKQDKKKMISWILVISWMILIFVMSNQPGNVSKEQSGSIVKIFLALGVDTNSAFGSVLEIIIRKSAHFIEYFILALLFYNLMMSYNVDKKRARRLMVIYAFIYASTDEIHQMFVPGRGPKFQDVLIDTSGAVVSSLFMWCLDSIAGKKSK